MSPHGVNDLRHVETVLVDRVGHHHAKGEQVSAHLASLSSSTSTQRFSLRSTQAKRLSRKPCSVMRYALR